MNVSRILRFWLKYFKFFTMMEKSMKYLSTGKGFPGGAKNPPVNAGGVRDMGLIPGLRRSPGGGHGNSLQYTCLENPMDRGAWWTTVHRVCQESDMTEMTAQKPFAC